MTIVGVSIFIINASSAVFNDIVLMKNSKYTVSLESYGWRGDRKCLRPIVFHQLREDITYVHNRLPL